MTRLRCALAVGLLAGAGLLSGCAASFEAGRTASVSKDKLAAEVKTQLEAQVGEKADSVECDGDLPARIGATQQCVLTDGGTRYGVTVTANSVEGDNIKFGIKVDDEPMT